MTGEKVPSAISPDEFLPVRKVELIGVMVEYINREIRRASNPYEISVTIVDSMSDPSLIKSWTLFHAEVMEEYSKAGWDVKRLEDIVSPLSRRVVPAYELSHKGGENEKQDIA